jgi:nitrile hydratase
MEIAVRELLVEKSILTAADITAQIEAMDERRPANGAAVVARAWVDPEFKARLLEEASSASREMGFDIGPLKLIAVENTKKIHNLIVCTLCSCYPRNLLGLPPDWYKTRAYRSRAVREPRKVLEEFGLTLEKDKRIQVHDSTADMRYLVLPARPEGTEGLSEAELAALVTRDSMIGTGLPKQP